MNFLIKKAKFIIVLSLISLSLFSKICSAGIALGTTRLIFPANEAQTDFFVLGDKDDTYLIQSWLENDKNEKSTDFILTPPIFLLKGKNESIIRVIKNIKNLPDDRESLYWLNVKAVPSSEKGKENVLKFAITNRIKMFYRPSGLNESSDTAYKKLEFTVDKNNNLKVKNNSPYYITIIDFHVGKDKRDNLMVSPFDSSLIKLNNKFNGSLSFSTINDYGAQTKKETRTIK